MCILSLLTALQGLSSLLCSDNFVNGSQSWLVYAQSPWTLPSIPGLCFMGRSCLDVLLFFSYFLCPSYSYPALVRYGKYTYKLMFCLSAIHIYLLLAIISLQCTEIGKFILFALMLYLNEGQMTQTPGVCFLQYSQCTLIISKFCQDCFWKHLRFLH